ncbi:MAG: sugar ABC transporter permease [Anaerolineae bacterium]
MSVRDYIDIDFGVFMESLERGVVFSGAASQETHQQAKGIHSDRTAKYAFLLPTVFFILLLSVFPLVSSLLLSLTRVNFVRGGLDIQFVGFANYEKLLFGSGQRHFIGSLQAPSLGGWLFLLVSSVLMIGWFAQSTRRGSRRIDSLFFRLLAVIITLGLCWIVASTLGDTGVPGTLVVTLIFVFVGVFFQYIIGLGLALLLVQDLPGKRFFRVIFLLPMTITPVGIGFLFRMLTDTSVGPFAPVWNALGLHDFSWADTGSGARIAVLIGDIWQWIPFMFIVLLAALEGISRDQVEAARVDGANRMQMFRHILLPQIAPVSLTVVLIRLIEAFKIIDMPRLLTGGGPGTATESMALHAYNEWRAPNLGGSAALSYLLLFVVTFVAMMFVNTVRQKIVERL